MFVRQLKNIRQQRLGLRHAFSQCRVVADTLPITHGEGFEIDIAEIRVKGDKMVKLGFADFKSKNKSCRAVKSRCLRHKIFEGGCRIDDR